jgi:hypothetical protein
LHGIILCLVFTGKYEKLHGVDGEKMAPAIGYHSVMAATRDEGGTVQFQEMTVYQEGSIIPIGLIMYTREGWEKLW